MPVVRSAAQSSTRCAGTWRDKQPKPLFVPMHFQKIGKCIGFTSLGQLFGNAMDEPNEIQTRIRFERRYFDDD
jgi:hypothetical protein